MTRRPAPADTRKVAVLGALLQGPRLEGRSSFGRVLFTFDPEYREDPVFLLWVWNEIVRLSRKEPVSADERNVVEAVSRELRADEARWRDMPARLTRHVRVHLVDIRLDEDLVPPGVVLGGAGPLLLPCQADPRCQGMAELLPCTAEDIERLEDLPAKSLASRGGKQVTAIRVQAQDALDAPGRDASLPGLVLLSFEEETTRGLARLEELADRLCALKERRPRDAAEQAARDAMRSNEDAAIPYRRVRLPASLTGDRVVFLADLWIRRRYLPQGYLADDRRLPCIAEPGDEGGIELLPWGDTNVQKSASPRRDEEEDDVERDKPHRPTERGPEAEAKRKLGWRLIVAGGVALVAGLVLLLLGAFSR